MESGQQQRRRKKHRSGSRSSHKKATTFFRFASCTPLKLDDVKTRGKKMAKTATRTRHHTSGLLAGSHVSKSRSLKTSSADRVSTAGQDSAIQPARASGRSPTKLPKKVDYKSPNVRELTKELVTRAKKPKVQLSNANHPVRRGKPKTFDGIFQRGRQRPTGPVRTFIVFKASSKHNEMRRRKPKRGLMSKLPSERRFSAVPVYNPRFYKKSELKGSKLSKLHLSDRINVQPAKTDDGRAPSIGVQSGAVAKATGVADASIASHNFIAPTSGAAERRGAKKVVPRVQSADPKKEPKLLSGSSSVSDRDKSAVGMAFEKKTHVGGAQQPKTKSKKKRLSVAILQKKPVRRRSHKYKLAKGKATKRHMRSKTRRAKKPAALALSRKSLLAIIRPGFETTLKKRIANMQRMKRLEQDGG